MNDSSQDTPTLRTQRSAAWLGGLGLLPFLTLAVAAHLADPTITHVATRALLSYGAVIVSFLGGIRWGFALSGKTPRVTWRLIQSVTPSLTGFAALLLPILWSCAVLIVTLVLLLWWDRQLQAEQEAPTWYFRLRWPLTIGAGLSILSLLF